MLLFIGESCWIQIDSYFNYVSYVIIFDYSPLTTMIVFKCNSVIFFNYKSVIVLYYDYCSWTLWYTITFTLKLKVTQCVNLWKLEFVIWLAIEVEMVTRNSLKLVAAKVVELRWLRQIWNIGCSWTWTLAIVASIGYYGRYEPTVGWKWAWI